MHTKRILSAILLILLIALPASAADITETASGATEAEAIAAVDSLLAQRIATNTAAQQDTIVSDDGSESTAYMSIRAKSTYDADFLGAVLDTEKLSDGTWTATKTIPESSYPLYRSRVEESAAIINRIYRSIEKSGTITRSDYTRISSQLSDYEVNSIVMRMLDSEADVPSVPTNSTDIEAMYQSSLERERNQTETTVRGLQLQSELGIITAEGQASLDKALQELQANRNEQNALRQAQALEAERERESFNESQRALMEAFSGSTATTTDYDEDDSASGMINEIEALKNTFSSYKGQMQMTIDNFQSQLDREISNERSAILDEPYLPIELDGRGRPRKEVTEAREAAVDEVTAELTSAYMDQANSAYADSVVHLGEISKRAAQAIEDINDASFSLSTPSPAVSASIESFNLTDLIWNGTANITIGNQSIELDFEIPFSAWTGTDVKEGESYYEYRTEIQDWSTILSTYPYSYSLSIDYTIRAYADESAYRVRFSHYTVTRTDTGKVVYSSDTDQEQLLEYDSSIDFSNVSMDSELISPANRFYPSKTVADIEKTAGEFTLRYEEDMKEEAARRAAEAEAKEQQRAAERRSRAVDRDMFSPGYFMGVMVDARMMASFGSASDLAVLANAKAIYSDFDILGIYFGINYGMLLINPTSMEDVTNALQGTLLTTNILSVSLDKFFPLSSTNAIELDLQLGATIGKEIGFAGSVNLGYFHRFSLVSLQVGATASYIAGDIYAGGYVGLGMLI